MQGKGIVLDLQKIEENEKLGDLAEKVDKITFDCQISVGSSAKHVRMFGQFVRFMALEQTLMGGGEIDEKSIIMYDSMIKLLELRKEIVSGMLEERKRKNKVVGE